MRRSALPAACFMLSAALLVPQLALAQAAGSEISLNAVREGEFVNVSASVDLPVERDLAWSVLTDYAQYPRFVSSLTDSRVSDRSPDGYVVDQKGEFAFLFFSRKIELRMRVVEVPRQSVAARSIGGDFRELSSRYELQPLGINGVRLVYLARFIPEFSLPPIIGMAAVEYVMRRDFSQLAGEILRRGARTDRTTE
jgi:ribosome-associated toxin RatA of RatAB toxin-antitoxin module